MRPGEGAFAPPRGLRRSVQRHGLVHSPFGPHSQHALPSGPPGGSHSVPVGGTHIPVGQPQANEHEKLPQPTDTQLPSQHGGSFGGSCDIVTPQPEPSGTQASPADVPAPPLPAWLPAAPPAPAVLTAPPIPTVLTPPPAPAVLTFPPAPPLAPASPTLLPAVPPPPPSPPAPAPAADAPPLVGCDPPPSEHAKAAASTPTTTRVPTRAITASPRRVRPRLSTRPASTRSRRPRARCPREGPRTCARHRSDALR